MSEAARYIPRYTVADYEAWDGDWELWAGVPVAMTPSPNRRHQRVAGRLYRQLVGALESDACPCEALYELDWRIGDHTVVCPDISVVCEPDDAPFITRPPTLIAEIISPSTASKDHVHKRRLYAEQGVTFYLLADPDARTLQTLQLSGDEYGPTDSSAISLHPGCTVAIDEPALWE